MGGWQKGHAWPFWSRRHLCRYRRGPSKLIFGAGTASRSTSLTHRCRANIDSIHRNWGTRYRAFTLLTPPWPPFLLDSSPVSPVPHRELRSTEVNDIRPNCEKSCVLFFFFRDRHVDRSILRYRTNLYARRADISKSAQLRVQRDRFVATIQINLGPYWPPWTIVDKL